jgi:3-dehydroquinate synthase
MADQLILPSGEQHKTLASVQRIWDFLLEHHATRSSLLINLGGGVICDLGGFAAATYMRGIAFINVPTTLLAMVDAAAGGKTGFDYGSPLIKNSIGLFAEPVATIYEPAFLATLPPEQLLSGYAEMIKHAALQSPQALAELLNHDLRDHPSHIFGELINHSVAFKQSIVEQDLHDHGLRQILNFGHTVGHAIEAASGGALFHGECVAAGMMYFCSEQARAALKPVLEKYGLPTADPFEPDTLLSYILHDKKMGDGGEITCVRVDTIGSFAFERLSPNAIRELIQKIKCL